MITIIVDKTKEI